MLLLCSKKSNIIDSCSPFFPYFLQNFDSGPVGIHLYFRSNVTFDPATTDTYMGRTVDIRGYFELQKPVSFQNCERLMIDGGSLIWKGSDSFIVSCMNITINGFFQPTGDIIFGRDIRDIIVGPSGRFQFSADGPIFTHTLSVSGVMEVKNKVILESPVEDDRKITVFVVHSPQGKLLLDTQNQSLKANGSVVPASLASELFADKITVNGLFDASALALPAPISSLTVGNGGNFTFDPTSELIVDVISVNGVFSSQSPLNISGASLIRTRSLTVLQNGTMTLDAAAQKKGQYSGVSYIVVEVVIVDGLFKAGKMINHKPPLVHGWNHMAVKGQLIFYPNDTFYLGYGEVSGILESVTPITILRPPSFELNGNHFVVDSGGQVKLGIQGASDSANHIEFEHLEVKVNGLLDSGFQKATPSASTVSQISKFLVTTLLVAGTFKSDSVNIIGESVTVFAGGTITTAGGGYKSGAGPGGL